MIEQEGNLNESNAVWLVAVWNIDVSHLYEICNWILREGKTTL